MWLIYLFFSLTLAPRAATGQLTDAATMSASIRSEAGYSLLPGCIKECIWDIGRRETNDIGGDLAAHLSCSRPYPNGCYCRGASATVAYSFLTECFNFLCTTPAGSDVNSGISIYTSYCSTALGAAYTPNATPEPAPEDDSPSTTAGPTTGSGPSSTLSKETGKPGSAPPTDIATASAAPKDDGKIMGLSRGAFIGVVISVACSVLGLIFGIGFKVYTHKKQARLLKEQVPVYNYTPKPS